MQDLAIFPTKRGLFRVDAPFRQIVRGVEPFTHVLDVQMPAANGTPAIKMQSDDTNSRVEMPIKPHRAKLINAQAMAPQDTTQVRLRYLWPTPTGLILWLSGLGVANFLGNQAFIATHALFEIGIVVSLVASVVHSIQLSGSGRSIAPRWVFFVNLAFGPLILGIIACVAFYTSVINK